MAFRIGNKVFVHADGRTSFITNEGLNPGVPFLVRAVKGLDAEQGGKAIHIQGQSIQPQAIAIASIEPTWKLDLDYFQVGIDLLEHNGDGAGRMIYEIITTFERPGLAPVEFIYEDAVIEKGFGFKSDAGAQPSSAFSGKMGNLKIRYKGKLYDPYSTPGAPAVF